MKIQKMLVLMSVALLVPMLVGCDKAKRAERRGGAELQVVAPTAANEASENAPIETRKTEAAAERGATLSSRTDKVRNKLLRGVRLHSIGNVSASLSGLEIGLTVSNTLSQDIVIKSTCIDVYSDGTRAMRVLLNEPLIVPRNSSKVQITVPFSFSLSSPLQALMVVGRLRTHNYEGMEVALTGVVELGGTQEEISLPRMEVGALKKYLGM